MPIRSPTQSHILIPSKLGIYVTKDAAWLDSDWMNVSDTLDVDPMFPQKLLNVVVFCQNSHLYDDIRFD